MMSSLIREISIKDIEGVSIGHAQDDRAKTGVSVIYFKNGAQVGCDISGGGVAASDGVMRCLEEHDIGYDTGYAKVPLVCQSCIFDLAYGRSDVRPDATMGYEACEKALKACDTSMGSVGAGTGACVGKMYGIKQSSKSGLGTHAIQVGELKIGAVVVVNAFGDVFNPENGEKITGLLDVNREKFIDMEEAFVKIMTTPKDLFHTNTTIGCIVCNARFDKAKLSKIASMTRNAYARCINPVGTMIDGDSIYACSVGDVISDVNVVGMPSSRVMEKAIQKAIEASKEDSYFFLK